MPSPVRALALLPAVMRAGPAGEAQRAVLEVRYPARRRRRRRRRRGHAGGRLPALAAATPAQHRECLCISGHPHLPVRPEAVGETTHDNERGSPHIQVVDVLGAVGPSVEEQLHDAGLLCCRSEHERRAARYRD
jgi:4'-phosphopantetheinyl transferase EntD